MRNQATSLRVLLSSAPASPPQTPMAASPSVIHCSQSAIPYGFPPGETPLPTPAPSSGMHDRPGERFGLNLHGGALRPEQHAAHSPGSSSPASDALSPRRNRPPHSVTSDHDDTVADSVPRISERTVRTGDTFSVEELSDFDDSDQDRPGVVRPYRIDDAESDRSRSRTRNPREIDRSVLNSFIHLHCSDDSDSTDIDQDVDFLEKLRQRREAKRIKRMTSGSIGKRTISESMGSDTDLEDLKPFLDVNEAGSSARRLRRRMGEGRSLLFQDPPPPRIDELEEPNTSEDELVMERNLASELPYYTLDMINMEFDSP